MSTPAPLTPLGLQEARPLALDPRPKGPLPLMVRVENSPGVSHWVVKYFRFAVKLALNSFSSFFVHNLQQRLEKGI